MTGVILALVIIGLAALACAVTVSDHRSGPERRLTAADRRARWEANR